MFIISPIKRCWVNHWSQGRFDCKMLFFCGIGIIVCVIFAFSLCFGEMVRESIIVSGPNGGQLDSVYIDDGIPPAPPTGVRVLQPGQIQERFEDYAPTGDLRMQDGQGDWIEYDINLEHPEDGGALMGDYYE